MAFAQMGLIQGANDPSKADLKTLTGESRLTHAVITPEEKTMEYYLVGTKEGEINLNNLKLFNNRINYLPSQYSEDAKKTDDEQNESKPKTSVIAKHHPRRNLPAVHLRQQRRV